MRVCAEEFRLLYMGNSGISEFSQDDIFRRLDAEMSVSMSRSDDDPLKSIAATDSMMHMGVMEDFSKQ
jgi:hypothetical protein